MKIIGITGTCGAGKGTIVEYLKKERGFKHLSVSGFITEEIVRRGLDVNRDNMRIVGNDLREKYGANYIVEELYNQAKSSGEDTIIESIRCAGEVDALKKKSNFILLAVDLDRKIRYERCQIRGSAKDDVSFEKFVEQEEKEMGNIQRDKQNIALCIEYSDYELDNGGSFEELYLQVDKVLLDMENLISSRS
jgi:dephospho-CoA kinase